MLPGDYDDKLQQDFSITERTTQTYRLNFDGTPSAGMVDGLDAMKQAIFLALSTERFRHEVYSWDYGIEIDSLIGQSHTPYLQSQLIHAIESALIVDDRILRVYGFGFNKSQAGTLSVRFEVETTQGTVVSEFEWTGGADV